MVRQIAPVQTPGRRRRSEDKRSAILDAALRLFTTDGYDRTSVDAIAARAGVSKRTIYDHFIDKETVFVRVAERVTDALTATVRAAVDEELTPGRDLRAALTAFAGRIVTRALPSPDYATLRRLIVQQPGVPRLPTLVRDRPERLLEQRFAELAAEGVLRLGVPPLDDPLLAARHFTALTIGIALERVLDRPDGAAPAAPQPELEAVIVAGVEAFLRAYATAPAPGE
ncbi:TetR/AcrR family transcriptional regulator [Dactylosporangium sp. NPDC051541]|uniref:TetR/AcrR family transcriptional regulator n=1 Tax=Dactylosporangium sp. NPDC051541 TaxID=3363977 RepID=UPI0037A2D15A